MSRLEERVALKTALTKTCDAARATPQKLHSAAHATVQTQYASNKRAATNSRPFVPTSATRDVTLKLLSHPAAAGVERPRRFRRPRLMAKRMPRAGTKENVCGR